MEVKIKLTPIKASPQQAFYQYNNKSFDKSVALIPRLKKRDKVKIALQRKLARFSAKEWL